MTALRPLFPLLACGSIALAACQDNQPHVFHAPPPRTPAASPAVTTSSSPEVPFGTTGAEARITAVVDGATGGPVALTDLRGKVSIITLVARGPGRPGSESARVELAMDGPRDTTLVLAIDAPAPTIVAHVFQLDVGHDFPSGAYTLTARIVAGGQTLTSSVPMHVVVGRQR